MTETAFVLLVGLFFAAAINLLLSRALIRMLPGVVLLGNAIYLLSFFAGRLTLGCAPSIPPGAAEPGGLFANPLPLALIQPAIVIGIALFAFLAVNAFRAYPELD